MVSRSNFWLISFHHQFIMDGAWNKTFFNGDAQASGYESPDSSQHSVSDFKLNQPVFDSEPSESESFEVLGLQVAQSSP